MEHKERAELYIKMAEVYSNLSTGEHEAKKSLQKAKDEIDLDNIRGNKK